MTDKSREMKKWQKEQFRQYEWNAAKRMFSSAAFFLLVYTMFMPFALSTLKL